MQQNCLRACAIGRCDAYYSSGAVSMSYSVTIVSLVTSSAVKLLICGGIDRSRWE